MSRYETFQPGDGVHMPRMIEDLQIADFFTVDDDDAKAEIGKRGYLHVINELGYVWEPR